MKNYYQILEVTPNAPPDIIKEQYYFLVQAWHPDKFRNPAQKLKAEEKIKEVNEAYAVLSNTIKRGEYDDQIGLPRASRWTEVEQHKTEQTKEHTSPAITVEELIRGWRRVSSSLMGESVRMAALLNSVTWIDLQRGILVLGFPSEIVAEMMQAEEKERTRKAVYDVLGVKLDVHCVVAKRRDKDNPATNPKG